MPSVDPSNASLSTYAATLVMLMPVSTDPAARVAIFLLLLATYAAAAAGNSLVLAAVARDRRLHRPVYVLVAALAGTDIAAASAIMPRLLANVVAGGGGISLPECVAQMAAVHLSVRTQGYVLALMALDRYTAVVLPLHYGALASARAALAAVGVAMAAAAAMVAANVTMVARVDHRCHEGGAPVAIRAPFCDFLGVAATSCDDDITAHVAVGYVVTVLAVVLPAGVITAAYVLVFAECRRAPATRRGLGKAATTCGTHLIVVAIFYAAILLSFANALPLSTPAAQGARYAVQVFLCTAPFVLNPVVYGMRMAEIKRAIVRLWPPRVGKVSPRRTPPAVAGR